jgi:DNA-binding NarL/FixJ family response regulator
MGLAAIISNDPRLTVSAQAESPAEAMAAIDASVPDLVITDITLGAASGLDLIRAIKVAYPKVPVLVVSIHGESSYAERALRLGAAGYLTKEAAANTVVTAILRVLEGGLWVSAETAARLLRRDHRRGESSEGALIEGLSDRELEIYSAIGNGHGTRDIAGALGVSVKTVETHRAHIKEKLGFRTSTELVQAAARWIEETRSGRGRQLSHA